MQKLRAILYGLQYGMSIAAKQGLNTKSLVETYLRLTMSVEKIARSVLRSKYPLPDVSNSTDPDLLIRVRHAKKVREHEYQKFLRDSRF